MPPQIENNISQSQKRVVLKRFFKIVGIPIILLFILMTGISYNFKTHSIWSCDYAYTELPIPDYLKGSEIVFEKPVYGESLGFGYDCLSIFSSVNHTSNVIWMEPNDLTSNKIPDGTKFMVYGRVYIACGAIGCMDGGGGDKLLLKDEQGKTWELDPDHFNPKNWSESIGFLFKAGYYKNGKRFGDVILERAFPASYYGKGIKDKWTN